MDPFTSDTSPSEFDLSWTTPTNTSIPTDPDLPPDPASWSVVAILSCITGSVITLVTFLGQILVFAVVSKDARLREPGNYFITSLALCDLLISLIAMPVWTVVTTVGYWPYGPILCGLWNVFDYVLCSTSLNTICIISIDRYLCLKYSLTYPAKRTGLKMKLVLGLTWVASLVFYLPAILIPQYFLHHLSDPNDCLPSYLSSVVLTVVMCSIIIWIPMFITLVMYVRILKIARKIASETIAASDVWAVSQNAAKTRKDDLKAVKTTGLLLSVCIVCWIPVTAAWTDFSLFPGRTNPWFLVISYWLCYINSALNPICYAIGNPAFRETFQKKILGRKLRST